MSPTSEDSLDLVSLTARYAKKEWSVASVMAEVRRRIGAYRDKAVWIDPFDEARIAAQISKIEADRAAGKDLPLFGIPFAVKDNMDVAGRSTTAACPAFAHTAEKTATVVQKICDAGAILVGKTNLDQFATGLVGVRSPYGACENTFDPKYISGGSSSGSAVAVAAGLVSFSLGTDTAGSGRVPAGFNNIVGYKPTRGLLSCAGVVPACKSLDCVSIFALTAGDAARVAAIARGFDAADSYSRRPREMPEATLSMYGLRFGIPEEKYLQFFGNADYPRLYREAIERFQKLGAIPVETDFEPFLQASGLLYQGPWIAERMAGLRDFVNAHLNDLLPVTARIFSGASKYDAADAFAGTHRLAEYRQIAAKQWGKMDLLLLPTTGTIYTRDQVAFDPIELNKNLGYYTQFVNLMDFCVVAVPAGLTAANLPFGVSLIAPAGQDVPLLGIADALHRTAGLKMGATSAALPPAEPFKPSGVLLAVVGAHLTGQPLNWQLTQRNARLVRTCRTTPNYRLYALANTKPPKPGLIRTDAAVGDRGIEVEVWQISSFAFGSFVAEIPPPLGIGNLELEDGSFVKGFICEPYAVAGSTDITHLGGWRAYLARK